MRFKTRVTVSVVALLLFTVTAIHLLAHFEAAPGSGLGDRGPIAGDHEGRRADPPQPRARQDAADDTEGQGALGHPRDLAGPMGAGKESQIHKPPLPRPGKTGNRKAKTLKKEEQPAWVRGSTFKKAWDDQEIIGAGHPWQQFHRDIHQDALYSEGAPYMDDLLRNLATAEIVNVSMFSGGSQVKLDFWLADGNRALVKPMRSPRELVYKYNAKEPFWLDQERHNAEIASFHLDSVLGFRRVPPCTGRLINLTKDVIQKSTDQELLKTFFRKDGNLCFIGKCVPWFCNADHPICGRGELIEVSLCQLLPSLEGGVSLFELAYPWSQGVKESLVWKGKNICLDFLKDPTWFRGRFLLDLIDQGIFDFFIRNYDRHHFDMLRKYKRLGHVMYLDNGKGFGNPLTDDDTFLAPVYQCCKVRRSTYHKLKELTRPGSLLSDRLRASMSRDPIAPVVTETHLQALDRRLRIALDTIDKCIKDNGESHVLVERLD